jgi:3-hydroxyacyl-CoA dehydrogenase
MSSSKSALPLPPSAVVAVVGTGAMGAGIAQVAAAAGHVVKLLDNRPAPPPRPSPASRPSSASSPTRAR